VLLPDFSQAEGIAKMKNSQKKASNAKSFRASVGAIIINENGKVLGLERKDIPGAWQLPQGGLDDNEMPVEAVKREIREETGIETRDLELLASTSRWLAYELPEEARSKKIGRGQVQRWFLFRFRGSDEAITLGDQKEFKAWKWIGMDELTSIVVHFKQPVYQELVEYFKLYFENLA
jgi:putative (di)nucleoside polyphosphate hydrolase